MASSSSVLGLSLAVLAMAAAVSEAGFYDRFDVGGSGDHVRVTDDGKTQQVALVMDRGSGGAGFTSRDKYLFGEFSVQMKLVGGNSAGTVTSFYVSKLFALCLTYLYLPDFVSPCECEDEVRDRTLCFDSCVVCDD